MPATQQPTANFFNHVTLTLALRLINTKLRCNSVPHIYLALNHGLQPLNMPDASSNSGVAGYQIDLMPSSA